MRSDDANQMAAPRDRHSPSSARGGGHAAAPLLASSHRLAAPFVGARCSKMSYVAPPSPLSPALSNSQPPRSLALDGVKLSDLGAYSIAIFTCQSPPQAQTHWTTRRLRAGEARRARSEPPIAQTLRLVKAPSRRGVAEWTTNDGAARGQSSSSREMCASSGHAASCSNRALTLASQVSDDSVPSAFSAETQAVGVNIAQALVHFGQVVVES